MDEVWQQSEFDPPPDPSRPVVLSALLGVGLVGVLHALVGGALFGIHLLAQELFPKLAESTQVLVFGWLMSVGINQLLYVLPVGAVLWLRGRSGMAAGVLIGASLTLLLQTACYGFFCATMSF